MAHIKIYTVEADPDTGEWLMDTMRDTGETKDFNDHLQSKGDDNTFYDVDRDADGAIIGVVVYYTRDAIVCEEEGDPV